MQTLIAHSAGWRGVVLFAGTLWVKVAGIAQLDSTPAHVDELVCWSSAARSRREDELVRIHQRAAAEPVTQDRPASGDPAGASRVF
jgi:hypothetical protein